MKPESSLLLACARSYSDSEYGCEQMASLCRQTDWTRLTQLARSHNLLPVVAAKLTDSSLADVIPDDARSRLKRTSYAAICHDAQFRMWMNRTLDILASAGIQPMVLKGPVLADYLYPSTYLRLSCDLDLMVRPEDLMACSTVLLESGYELRHHLPAAVGELEGTDLSGLSDTSIPTASAEYTRRHDYHLSFEAVIDGKRRLVELHWKPAPSRSAVLPVDEIWRQAASIEIAGRKAYAMSPEHQVVFLLFHMINHGWQQGFMRSMLDLSLMMSAWQEMDWREVAVLCGKQTARGHAYHILSWAREHMGVTVPDQVLDALRPTPYERWSSRPFCRFEDILALSQRRCDLQDIAEGLAESEAFGDKARFVMGIVFPPVRGLAQMSGRSTGAGLYLCYIYRPIAGFFSLLHRCSTGSEIQPQDRKVQLSDRSTVFRLLERINTAGSSWRSRRGGWPVIGKAINLVCARGFDLYTLCVLNIRRLLHPVDLGRLATALTKGSSSDGERADVLCRYVYDTISYARSVTWLDPPDVIRLGYGDCKCQARLLQELLAASGLESRVVVGITGRRAGVSRVHAWVETRIDGRTMICDATLSSRTLEPGEYDQRTGGILDVTPEYAMKRWDERLGIQPSE